jgi:hypothetical protein
MIGFALPVIVALVIHFWLGWPVWSGLVIGNVIFTVPSWLKTLFRPA